MTRHWFWTAPLSLAAALLATPAHADAPELVSVEKIWDRGAHNAFTDLVRWRGKWYCTFREADGHVGGDGKLRVLESADGKAWEPVALIAEEGIDLRDPKLAITPKDRLMIVAGGSVYRGTKTLLGIAAPRLLLERRPRVVGASSGPLRGRMALAGHLARRQGLRRVLHPPGLACPEGRGQEAIPPRPPTGG